MVNLNEVVKYIGGEGGYLVIRNHSPTPSGLYQNLPLRVYSLIWQYYHMETPAPPLDLEKHNSQPVSPGF